MNDALFLFFFLLVCVVCPREFLTAMEAAALLRVRQSKVLAWLRSGELRGFDLSEKPGKGRARWKISRDDLQAFLEKRQPKPLTSTSTPNPRRKREPNRPDGWVECIQ